MCYKVAELDALLEAERQGKLDRSGKGNSLFSEVEDKLVRLICLSNVFFTGGGQAGEGGGAAQGV